MAGRKERSEGIESLWTGLQLPSQVKLGSVELVDYSIFLFDLDTCRLVHASPNPKPNAELFATLIASKGKSGTDALLSSCMKSTLGLSSRV